MFNEQKIYSKIVREGVLFDRKSRFRVGIYGFYLKSQYFSSVAFEVYFEQKIYSKMKRWCGDFGLFLLVFYMERLGR
jgi:hypothetical protein